MSQGRPYSIYANIQIYSLYKSRLLDLVCGDILYDQPENENFKNKLEKVQYRACLAITGGIQGKSRQKL